MKACLEVNVFKQLSESFYLFVYKRRDVGEKTDTNFKQIHQICGRAHSASALTYQGRHRRDKREATEEMHQETLPRTDPLKGCSPHQSREGPKSGETHIKAQNFLSLSSYSHGAETMAIHHSRKTNSMSSRMKSCTCPDVSHHLSPNQRNWDWPWDVHWENKDKLK